MLANIMDVESPIGTPLPEPRLPVSSLPAEAGPDTETPLQSPETETVPSLPEGESDHPELDTLEVLKLVARIDPNSSDIRELVRRTELVLESATGSSALTGYEDGADRACRTAAAAFRATRLSIRTGGEFSGPSQFPLIYAGVLEAVGLRPLVMFLSNRSSMRVLTGFFTSESRLPAVVVESDTMISNLVRSGQIVLVDPAAGHFADSVMVAHRMSLDLHSETVALVDVHLARRETNAVSAGLVPHAAAPGSADTGAADPGAVDPGAAEPPASILTPWHLGPFDQADLEPGSGHADSLDLPAAVAAIVLDSADRPAEPGYEAGAFRPADDAPRRIRAWKRTLLDLSLRNPLLNLPKTAGRGIAFVLPTDGLARLEDLIQGGKSVTLIARDEVGVATSPATDNDHDNGHDRDNRSDRDNDSMLTAELADKRAVTDVLAAGYRDRFRALRRTAVSLEQETGANYLYLAMGALLHPKRDGGFARAPLFLLPVRIEGGVGWRPYRLVADSDGVASANNSLVEWLRTKHGLHIPALEQPTLASGAGADVGIDIASSLSAISDALVKAQLEYRVEESAGLYLLGFSTFRMWQDLDQSYLELMKQPVVEHLVSRAGQPFVERPSAPSSRPESVAGHSSAAESPPALSIDSEAAIPLPIAADSSQLLAVQMASQGRSFVLEGPPGTGKSQTITNIIAHTLASGRSVLFVAEKQAALEVVKQRLEKVGLGDFILDLHGRDQRLNTIRAQLNTALAATTATDEIAWNATISKFRSQLEPLARYPRELHEIGPGQLSAWSAYDTLLALGAGPVAVVPAGYLGATPAQVKRCTMAVRELPTLAASAKLRPQHPWALVSNPRVSEMPGELAVGAAQALESARQLLLARSPDLASLLAQLDGPLQLEAMRPVLAQLRSGALPPSNLMLDQSGRQGWDAGMSTMIARIRQVHSTNAALLSRFNTALFAAVDMTALVVQARAVEQGLFGRKRRRRAVVAQLNPYLVTPETLEPKSISSLVEKIAAIAAECAAINVGVRELGGVWLPGWRSSTADSADFLAAQLDLTVRGRQIRSSQPAVWQWLSHSGSDVGVLDAVVQGWRQWLGVVGADADALNRWAGGGGWSSSWHRDGPGWVLETAANGTREAHRFALLHTELAALSRAGLGVFADSLFQQQISMDQAESALSRGVASVALSERLDDLGLTLFDGSVQDHRIEEFLLTGAKVRQELPVQLAGTVVSHRDSEITNGPKEAAALRVQLGRKRGGLSFRELFSAYGSQITAATPCLMMSPTSAAAYLEPRAGQFDLVIFDEASQIRTSQAIGVMGRGRSIIIVGDSKQMPPTSVMMSSTSAADTELVGPEGVAGPDSFGDNADMEADPAPSDADSILMEAVESGLPQVWLSWHYRSRDESLISFSNQHYYSGGLASFPAPGGDPSVGVRRIRVLGNFERGTAGSRTNPIEAAAVVAEIARRLADPSYGGQSLGVVTFNIQQRDLISNLLEDSKDDAILAALADTEGAEQIFVKNLENVQGDERDVILFSPAYSVDPSSGRLPLNFGPLSNAGGERRLNVAITRARRQVLLFTSFDPSDLELRRTSAVGTHHFRAYLESAVLEGVQPEAASAPSPALRVDPLPGSRLRQEIARALVERGLVAQTEFGLSSFKVDIAVRRPGSASWQVAVMIDGPQWLARGTVSDRDGTPGLLHSMMGWPAVQRVWLPHWVNNREEVLARIIAGVPNE